MIWVLLLALAPSSFAESKGCEGGATKLSQIKDYLTCQNSLSFVACGALGGAAAGRVGSAVAMAKYRQVMTTGNKEIDRKLGDFLFNQWRERHKIKDAKERIVAIKKQIGDEDSKLEAAERQVYNHLMHREWDEWKRRWTIQKTELMEQLKTLEANEKNGRPSYNPVKLPAKAENPLYLTDAANTEYDGLSENQRSRFSKAAEKLREIIEKRISTGKPLDDKFIEAATLDLSENLGKSASAYKPDLTQLRAAVTKGVELFAGKETQAFTGFGKMILAAKALGRASPLAAAGVAGAAFFAIDQIANATHTGCSDVYSSYVNQDPNKSCKITYELNDNVAQFLSKPEAEQRKVLNDHPEVCAFYRGLHRAYLGQPRFEGLECQANGAGSRVTLKTRDDQGTPREYRVDVRSDDSVQALGVYSASGMKTRLYNFANQSSDLTTKLGVDSGAGRELARLKTFVPEAISCCRERTSECSKDFGAGGSASSPSSTSPATSH